MGKVFNWLIIAILVSFCLSNTTFAIYTLKNSDNNKIMSITVDRLLEIDSTTGDKTLNPAIDSIVDNHIIYVKPNPLNATIEGLVIKLKNISKDIVEVSHLNINPLSVQITNIDSSELVKNRRIAPDSTSSLRLSFKLNQGNNWAIFVKVFTNTKEKLSDLSQNPEFKIFGNTRIPVLKLEGIQKQNYAHFSGLNYYCNKSQKILIKNLGNAPLGNIVIKTQGGDSLDFEIPKTYKTLLDTNGVTEVEIFPKPQSQIEKDYNTTLVIYSNAINNEYFQPISYKATFPKSSISIRKDTLSTDTSLISNSKTLIKIPIFYSLSNVYSFKKLAFRLGFELPPESRKSIDLDSVSFVAGPDVVGDYTSTTSTLGNKSEVVNVQTIGALSADKNSIQDALLGFLRFTYFLSEEKTSTIKINLFEIINENELTIDKLNCNILSMNNPQAISIKRLDTICLDSTFTAFMNNLRAKTIAFHASMQVSGEPVMEIQHFFKDPMHAEISLYSVNGMKLETVFSGLAPSDLHQFRHPMGHLTPGVYFCEMIAGQFRKTIPILLTR